MKKSLKNVVFVLWQDDSGIFVDADQYDRDTKIHVALGSAKTWGEFRKLMPPDEFEELSQWRCNDGEQIFEQQDIYYLIQHGDLPEFMESMGEDYIIHSTDTFDPMQVWGFGDGDYPGLHNNTSDDSFHDEFVQKYGTPVSSMVAGSWTQYPLDKLEEMTAELEKYGFEVFQDLSMNPMFNCLP